MPHVVPNTVLTGPLDIHIDAHQYHAICDFNEGRKCAGAPLFDAVIADEAKARRPTK